MAAIKYRYYIWLFKAYYKRWKKTIIASVIIGILIFFLSIFSVEFYIKPLLEKKVTKIGYEGVYTTNNIPEEILENVSYGLTKVKDNGEVVSGAASRWEIKNGGKEYIFHLKKNLRFQDGEELTAEKINLNFKDVTSKILDKYTVSYTLKTVYAPFLVSVSKPILKGYYVGLGEYKVSKIDLNADFIKSIVLQKVGDARIKKNIFFYPTKDALKTAFMLGEVDTITSIDDIKAFNVTLSEWKNVRVTKKTDYEELVTLFYNNEDTILEDKKVRQALNYALPEEFSEGVRSFSPISPLSIYFSKSPNYGISDSEIAKTLLSSAKGYQGNTLTISTTQDYVNPAKAVQKAWEKIGVKSKIEVVEGIPATFQVLLYKYKLPKDPDQYTLWHSQGASNIAKYKKSVRIDKLLEEGRLTTDINQRVKVYADFQKYLLDDVPASFLYFPTMYTIERK